jgi:hypothetical protein
MCTCKDCHMLRVKPVFSAHHSLSVVAFATYFLGKGGVFQLVS